MTNYEIHYSRADSLKDSLPYILKGIQGPHSFLELDGIKDDFDSYVKLNTPYKISEFLDILSQMIQDKKYLMVARLLDDGCLFHEISDDRYEWWTENGCIIFTE